MAKAAFATASMMHVTAGHENHVTREKADQAQRHEKVDNLTTCDIPRTGKLPLAGASPRIDKVPIFNSERLI